MILADDDDYTISFSLTTDAAEREAEALAGELAEDARAHRDHDQHHLGRAHT